MIDAKGRIDFAAGTIAALSYKGPVPHPLYKPAIDIILGKPVLMEETQKRISASRSDGRIAVKAAVFVAAVRQFDSEDQSGRHIGGETGIYAGQPDISEISMTVRDNVAAV